MIDRLRRHLITGCLKLSLQIFQHGPKWWAEVKWFFIGSTKLSIIKMSNNKEKPKMAKINEEIRNNMLTWHLTSVFVYFEGAKPSGCWDALMSKNISLTEPSCGDREHPFSSSDQPVPPAFLKRKVPLQSFHNVYICCSSKRHFVVKLICILSV